MFKFQKKKKALRELEDKYLAFQMSFENNYKDLAMIHLQEYEQMLEQYAKESRIEPAYYEKAKSDVTKKRQELKNFNHKQHIGW